MPQFDGSALRRFRENKKLTQGQLAKKLGSSFSKQHVYSWESGKCAPKVTTLCKISEALDTPIPLFFADCFHHSDEKNISINEV